MSRVPLLCFAALVGLACGDDGASSSDATTSGTDDTAGPTSSGPTTVADTTTTDATTETSLDGSTTTADACGNGVMDADEACDGDDLGGRTCADLGRGFTGGTLSCDPGCELDTSSCYTCGDGTCEALAGEDNAICSEDCGVLEPTWAVVIDGSGGIFANDLAVDGAGNVFLVGSMFGTVDFGAGDVTAASTDVFVAKYDPDGALQWADSYGDASDQLAFATATDSVGNVWVAGSFRGDLSFGGPTLSGGAQFSDIFVAKLDPDGMHLFSADFGGATEEDEATSLAVDSADGLVVVGRFQTSIDFGGGALDAAGGAGDFDAYIAHFDASLNPAGAASYGDGAAQRLAAVAIDADDAVVVGGSSEGAIDFGGGTLPNAAGERAVLAKIAADDTRVFSHLFSGDGPSGARSVAVAPSGDVIVAGTYTSTIDFGDGPVMSGGVNNDDAFVARFDADGNLVHGEGYGDASSQRATDVAVDSLDRPAFTGSKVGVMTVGGVALPPFGGADAFIAKLTPTAAAYWAGAFGDGENEVGAAVAIDAADDTLWAANVSGAFDLGVGATCTGCQNAVVLAKLGP